MSNNKMLIDAAHPEETRVVVLRDGRVEEFDYESAARKLLRGNIYLAKVTRVEPSLQAAFVDYGGNRHGFLAFNEIHPDYYQIPIADRELLKEEEAAAEAEADAVAEERAERRARQQRDRQSRRGAGNRGRSRGGRKGNDGKRADAADADAAATDAADAAGTAASAAAQLAAGYDGSVDDDTRTQGTPAVAESSVTPDATIAEDLSNVALDIASPDTDVPREIGLVEDQGVKDEVADGDVQARDVDTDDDGSADDDIDDDDDDDDDADGDDNGVDDQFEEVGSEDAIEEVAARPRRRARQYKIQEVIKRRQVILVQVVKEERGNKGAALTTYLSLAGRYTVLMPNTGRGGGISRKITNAQDRKRLKAIATDLEVPEGMGLIIRTAGASRTQAEIKRDFEYLLRLWESVRELTLESSAPNLVYEEGNLIKRSIRDLYSKDVDEILVAGDQAHSDAKEFMAMLMPTHAKHVVAYQQPEPLFAKYQIERQLNAMFSPYVTLKSGGYIVINQTEALVSVDVNSGKSTREFSIENTALKTNLEAAQELARQLKLRDLAGLIVIDFIDMEERRNNRAVERKIKDCLSTDRARIQVGRISHFGLLEMSRQRMRTGVLEGSTTQCPHCTGTGVIRSTESVALGVLRALEDTLLGNNRFSLTAVTTSTVALYILNHKRAFINEMEDRYGITLTVEASERMQGANFSIDKSAVQSDVKPRRQSSAVNMESGFETTTPNGRSTTGQDGDDDEKKPRKRRRRGGRRSRGGVDAGQTDAQLDDAEVNGSDVSISRDDAGDTAAQGDRDQSSGEQSRDAGAIAGAETEDGEMPRRSRRRGRRGGRRNRAREQGAAQDDAQDAGQAGGDGNGSTMAVVPGTGEQPDVGDVPAMHGGAPRALPGEAYREPAGEPGVDAGETTTKPKPRKPRSPRNAPTRRSAKPAVKEAGAGKESRRHEGDEASATSGTHGGEARATRSSEPQNAATPDAAPAEPAASKGPRRKGWWQRAFSSD